MPSGLTPHPLIVGLAQRLAVKKKLELHAAIQGAQDPTTADAVKAANEFASAQPLPELALFAGFLGGTIEHAGTTWRLLYQDPKAVTWLLVEDDEIVWYDSVDDKSSPSGRRDVLWLKKETTVGQGAGHESAEAHFLRGTFTSAGDLHASLIDERPPPAGSGILCAPTIECRCSPYYTR
jgi:hypothetical protein